MTSTSSQGYGNRAHPRMDFVESVQIHVPGEHNLRQVSALNLSLKGIFLQCDNPLPIGTQLDIQFAIRTGTVLAQKSRVVWCTSEQGANIQAQPASQPSGMGVYFENLSGQSETIIQQVVEDWLMEEIKAESSEIEAAILGALHSRSD